VAQQTEDQTAGVRVEVLAADLAEVLAEVLEGRALLVLVLLLPLVARRAPTPAAAPSLRLPSLRRFVA
jgi:hypothetical protein